MPDKINAEQAKTIAIGYMGPRSHAINYFAQHGTLLITSDASCAAYDDAKAELLEAIENEYKLHKAQTGKEHESNMRDLMDLFVYVTLTF